MLLQGESKTERDQRVAELMKAVGLADKMKNRPNQLSGGQQQLVAIARALIIKPQLILADEPTGNLHSNQAREIMETLKELNEEGVTIIQVTHNEQLAGYGTRIIELVDGRVENDYIPEVANS